MTLIIIKRHHARYTRSLCLYSLHAFNPKPQAGAPNQNFPQMSAQKLLPAFLRLSSGPKQHSDTSLPLWSLVPVAWGRWLNNCHTTSHSHTIRIRCSWENSLSAFPTEGNCYKESLFASAAVMIPRKVRGVGTTTKAKAKVASKPQQDCPEFGEIL